MLKNIRLYSAFSLLIGALILFSCSEDNPTTFDLGGTNPTYDGRVIGYVHGVVTDAVVGTRLAGVTVTYPQDGTLHTTVTDSTGMYAIAELSEGNYEFSFSYAPDSGEVDYAVSKAAVAVTFIAPDTNIYGNSNEDYHISFTRDIGMYPMNSSLTGKVYARPNSGTLYPADSAEVKLDYSNYDISVGEITATTDSTGTYLFENIPSTPDVNVIVLPFSDGDYTYGVETEQVDLVAGGIVIADNIELTIAGDAPLVISNNFTEGFFPVDQDLTLTFSKPMNTETFNIILEREDEDSVIVTVQIQDSWNAEAVTLTINPIPQLRIATEYTLIIQGKSQDENEFFETLYFNTTEGIEVLSTNLIEVEGVTLVNFPRDGSIEITFSRTVSINHPGNFLNLIEDYTLVVPITVQWEEDNTKAVITPDIYLKRNTSYNFHYTIYSTYMGDAVSGSIIFYTIDEGIGIITSNLFDIYGNPVDDFLMEDDIIVTFSDEVDINNPDNSIELFFDSVLVITTVTWEDNNTKLAVDPTFPLLKNMIYNFCYNIYSINENDYISGSIDFYTIDEGIEVDSTNVEDICGDPVEDFPLGGDIKIYFSQSADPDNENNFINLASGGLNLFFTESWNQDYTELTIDPILDLSSGSTYVIQFSIYSTISNDYIGGYYTFYTSDPTQIPGDVEEFALDMPVGWTADWNTSSFNFEWRTSPEVEEYKIYVHDNMYNPQWIILDTLINTSYLVYQSEWVNLPPSFDLYSNDDIQTPLSNGIEVTFAIIAGNYVGESSMISAPMITISDETAPEPDLYQYGTANFDSSLSGTFTIEFSYEIEYCDPASSPIFDFVECSYDSITGIVNGDSSYVLPYDAVDWDWSNNLRSGTFTIVVPDSSDGSGDKFWCTGFTDNSGNASTDTIWVELY